MRFLKYLCILIVYVVSYWIGFQMYKNALWAISGERLGGDTHATVLWTVFAYVPTGLIYLFIWYIIRHIVNRPFLRYSLYPICCSLIFWLPTLFFVGMLGGGSLFSSEAQLLHIMFASTGITFGLGFSLVSIVFNKSDRQNKLKYDYPFDISASASLTLNN